jgi:hypothetical protein
MPGAFPAIQQKNAFYPFEQLALKMARKCCTDTACAIAREAKRNVSG